MKLAWKIFRAVVSVLLLLAVLLPLSVYVLLSVPGIQNKIRDTASSELTRVLGADVGIGHVNIHPFNRLTVDDLSLAYQADTIATISTVSAGFEFYHFIRTGELVINYALIEGADIHIWRADSTAPLNIEPIIAHLKSDDPKETNAFELKINTVVLRDGELTYDVLTAPAPDSARFCPTHIAVSELSLNAYIPKISDSRYQAQVDHLSLYERSGFTLDKLTLKAFFSKEGAGFHDFSVDLPSSHLSLGPVSFDFDGYSDILPALKRQNVKINTVGDNYVYLPDLAAFAPILGDMKEKIDFAIDAEGNVRALNLRTLSLRNGPDGAFSAMISGDAENLLDKDSLIFNLTRGSLHINGPEIASLLSAKMPAKTARTLRRIPQFTIGLRGSGTLTKGEMNFKADGSPGSLLFNGSYNRNSRGTTLRGTLKTDGFDISTITGQPDFGAVTAKVDGYATLGRRTDADVKAEIASANIKGYDYRNISADLKLTKSEIAELNLSVNDPNVHLLAYGFYNRQGDNNSLRATATASGVDFNALGLDKDRENYTFGAKLNVSLDATSLDDISGNVDIFDIRWLDEKGQGLNVSNIALAARPDDEVPSVTVNSDIIKGSIQGPYAFTELVPQLSDFAATFLPALFDSKHHHHKKCKPNDFSFKFTVLPSREICSFFNLPVQVITDININGRVDSEAGRASVDVDAPYLVQGNKLIENTHLYASLDTAALSSNVYITSKIPTKKGDMGVTATIRSANNRIDTHADWAIERAIPINGSIDFSTLLRSKPGNNGGTFPLDALITFNPGTINFGDEIWTITPSEIDIAPERIEVDGFRLDAAEQLIAIDGQVGNDEADSLAVTIEKLSLVPIFETLEIDKALISGRASGKFSASNLLGSAPAIQCPRLHVDSIGYQYCTIGDADVMAKWDNDKKSVYLNADITGLEGRKSRIYGDIFPLGEALDLNFVADSIPVGFLKPFMVAFTSSITGRASGHCRLFGTFKEIDLEGDVMADNVKLKIDFTGTSYTATDSVHMTPGKIVLDNVTIRDPEGHTARLDGIVKHTFFKDPEFKFDISRADNLLSYNTTSRDNPDWYGKIYANGNASISGYPGVVNINVDMSTAPRSTFDFVMSDRLDAEEYSFITFRDRTPDSLKIAAVVVDDTPEAVKEFRRKASADSTSTSDYNMDIRVGVTPEATVTLVMDPAAGDRIVAHGEGNLHMAYNSSNNDLNIWGKYKVDDGSYRFTLQDIIIKDFVIKEGSEIQFDGDPYAVKTNLNAYYATNANLSDLDESFLQDKDVARTNVPVHALMKVTGDIRQPSIDFDLEFPTLTSDTYRKVRSIVSTEDMMNRQIIYLLALNRFYTPDYMASTTKGSELFSVASSTISSQLGNMLGKLSDKWSIAPNLRSDRGDFSDVEVDLALSSRLLNNRLIFNGNFGYRDKALNSNQFIGDFDIEYLLNKRGSWRLKAYNRYNDRNYYLRSAQTTQGIGIMFRRDFDSFLSFIRRARKSSTHSAADSTATNEKKIKTKQR